MRLCLLASGSSGNCAYLEAGGTRILIDAGISLRQVRLRLARIGVSEATIDGLLISHEHSDHVGQASRVALHFDCPIYASERTALKFRRRLCGWEKQEQFQPETRFAIGALEIEPFRIPHDACEPCGFLIQGPSQLVGPTVSAAIATDLGLVSPKLRRRLASCEALIIEANHDTQMLLEGPYPQYLKQRIQSELGHLSNDSAAELIAQLAREGRLRQVLLAHLSRNNNRPEVALETVRRHLDGQGDCRLHLSYRDRPSELLVL